jgi:pimeloyl-ACP methyl ester carboxylesterase
MGEVTFVTASDGVKLAAHVSGKGPPLYVIHGGPANDHTGFGNYLEPIAAYRQLYLLDQRGCGSSEDAPVASYTLRRLGEDIEDLRRNVGHEKVDLLGHSFGGPVSLAYAGRWPHNVNSLVLVDTLIRGWLDIVSFPGGWTIWARYGLESLKRKPDWASLQLKYEVADPKGGVEVARLLSGVRYDPAREAPLIRSASRRMDARRLINGGVPVMGIYGKQDPRFLGGANHLRSIGATVKLISGSGHQPYVEQPDKFHRILREFLLGTREPAHA